MFLYVRYTMLPFKLKVYRQTTAKIYIYIIDYVLPQCVVRLRGQFKTVSLVVASYDLHQLVDICPLWAAQCVSVFGCPLQNITD